MILRSTAEANGVSITSNGTYPTRITFTNPGTYNIQFSAQFHNTGGGGSGNTCNIWFRLNGSDLPNSDTKLTVPSNAPYVVGAWNFVETTTAGQYVEIIWSTDNANIILENEPAVTSPPSAFAHPAIPSVIVTVQQIMYTQVGPQGAQGAQGPQGTLATSGRKAITGTASVTINTAAVTANSVILANYEGVTAGGVGLTIQNRVVGASFDVVASNPVTGTINWALIG